LDLRNRAETLRGEPDRQPGNEAFGERRIDHAIRPEAVEEPLRRAEYAAFGADILADDEHRWVVGHSAGERQVYRLDERDLGHSRLTFPPGRALPGVARRDRSEGPGK